MYGVRIQVPYVRGDLQCSRALWHRKKGEVSRQQLKGTRRLAVSPDSILGPEHLCLYYMTCRYRTQVLHRMQRQPNETALLSQRVPLWRYLKDLHTNVPMEHSLERRGYPEWRCRACHALLTTEQEPWHGARYSVQRLWMRYGACCWIAAAYPLQKAG